MRKLSIFAAYCGAVLLLAAGIFTYSPAPTAAAVDFFNSCGSDCAELKDDGLTIGASDFKAKNIINLTLQILAGVAVIMVIVGAIRLASSHGDPGQVKAGRETILYALVGLIVAVSAYAIINFVVSFKW